jgi:hypothetical protein
MINTKTYWIKLKGQEQYPIVLEVNASKEFEGFITGTRIFKDGTRKKFGFNAEDIATMEEKIEEENEEEYEE